MPVQQVIIPYNDASVEVRKGWEKEISTILAEGNDVQFVDSDGVERNVNHLGLFSATDGAVKSRGVGMSDAEAVTKTLVAGGYFDFPLSYVYASGTDAGLGLHVKLEY